MQAVDIERIVKDLAPYEFAYEGEELGIIYGNPNKEVQNIGVTWRPTKFVLEECMAKRIDALIIHEPLLQTKKTSVIPPEKLRYLPNQLREALLIRSNLTVIRAHSNWDDAPQGNNDTLAQKLMLQRIRRIPFGRVGSIRPCSLEIMVTLVKTVLDCQHLLVVGELDQQIQTVAVVSGSGNALTEMIEISKQEGADVLISGDIQDSRARFGRELGLALIDAGGYYTETPGMQHLAQLIQEKLPQLHIEYLDPGPPWQVS